MATITIKNLPSDIHAALKAKAREHGRSLNGEVISCLKAAMSVARVDAGERLRSVDRIRRADGARLDESLLRAALDEGRP